MRGMAIQDRMRSSRLRRRSKSGGCLHGDRNVRETHVVSRFRSDIVRCLFRHHDKPSPEGHHHNHLLQSRNPAPKHKILLEGNPHECVRQRHGMRGVELHHLRPAAMRIQSGPGQCGHGDFHVADSDLVRGLGGGLVCRYFGTTAMPVLKATTIGTAITVTGLARSTTYYWKIVPKSGCGAATGCPIWHFKTAL